MIIFLLILIVIALLCMSGTFRKVFLLLILAITVPFLTILAMAPPTI